MALAHDGRARQQARREWASFVGAEVVEGVEPAVDQADAGFPLDAAAVDELLAGLQARLVALLRRRGRGQGELRAILG